MMIIIETLIPKFIVLTIFCTFCTFNTANGKELKNHRVADPKGYYHYFWEANNESIIFEVQVATKGYVGFGISPNGGMPESDIIIAWVLPNGTVVFSDRHATAFAEPIIDKDQNWELIEGHENDTHTIIRFTRKLNTCDKKEDIAITDDTMKIIFAWHPEDPKDVTGLPYHGPDRRGNKDTLLLSPQPPPLPITDDITIWEVTMPNVSIPPQITTYWCSFYKLPEFNSPMDFIGYELKLTPGNEKIVHHFVLFECLGNESHVQELMDTKKGGYECVFEGTLAGPTECQPPIIIYLAGSEGQILPDDVGIPVGKQSKRATYFEAQIHYNNMEKKAGMVDSSTLQVFLTNKIRPKRAAYFQAYANIDYSFVIPPKQPEFTISAFYPPQCTQNGMPSEGITVFAVGLHAHIYAKRLSLRHFRGGKELKPLVEENNYSFYYQALRQLREPVKILPGDILMNSCTYSSENRSTLIAGGYGTESEMCTSYISYYPAMDLQLCIGGPHYEDVFDYFGVEKLGEDKVHIESPATLQNKSMFTYLQEYDWNTVDDKKLQRMKDMQYYDVKSIFCQYNPTGSTKDESVEYAFPTNITKYIPEPDICDLKSTPKAYPAQDNYYEITTPAKKQYY